MTQTTASGSRSASSNPAAGRRELSFRSLDDVVADADMLVAAPQTRMLGNWPLDKLLMHLATAVNGSIDGVSFRAPFYIRLVGPLIKRRFLTQKMPPGFKLPKGTEQGFFPSAGSAREAAEVLRKAIARLPAERMTSKHPVFGRLSHDEWTQLHLRHAELHLSFARPD
jgi:hypothetical protein